MVLAAVSTPLLVFGALALVAWLAPLGLTLVVYGALVLGAVVAVFTRSRTGSARRLERDEAPALHATTERLCIIGDLPRPIVMLDAEAQPNSWLVHRAGAEPELHVTRGLLEVLAPDELEAVVAHELSHLAHRDARVMTVVGGPGSALIAGGWNVMRIGSLGMLGGLVAVAIGGLSRIGTSALSRYRELAADAGSAALTGRPAALAAALRKLSGQLERLPTTDLRTAAARDAFNLLPVGGDGGRFSWLAGTHPPLARRIAQLETLERGLHQARPAPPADPR